MSRLAPQKLIKTTNIMKQFVNILSAIVVAAILFSCEQMEDVRPVKAMKHSAEQTTPEEVTTPEDATDPELGTEAGDVTAPEEGTPEEGTPEVEPTPEVKDVYEVFAEMYPDATDVEWEDEDGYLEVEFELPDGTECKALFDQNGNWLCTTTEIEACDIPQFVFDALAASEYAEAELEDDEADYVETPEGYYYVLELELDEYELEVAVAEDGTITVLECELDD